MKNTISKEKFVEDLYVKYFSKYNDDQVKNGNNIFKKDISFLLSEVYDELKYTKDSKISINQYEARIKAIKNNRDDLQKYCSEEIKLKLPKHPSEIFHNTFLLLFQLSYPDFFNTKNEIKRKQELLGQVFKEIYINIFNEQDVKKPKCTKGAKETASILTKGIEESINRQLNKIN